MMKFLWLSERDGKKKMLKQDDMSHQHPLLLKRKKMIGIALDMARLGEKKIKVNWVKHPPQPPRSEQKGRDS
jgi:hypothetical protein